MLIPALVRVVQGSSAIPAPCHQFVSHLGNDCAFQKGNVGYTYCLGRNLTNEVRRRLFIRMISRAATFNRSPGKIAGYVEEKAIDIPPTIMISIAKGRSRGVAYCSRILHR
jgi:hypothetical protein